MHVARLTWSKFVSGYVQTATDEFSTGRKFVRLGVPLTVNAQDYAKSHPNVRVIKVNTVNPLLSPPFSGGES